MMVFQYICNLIGEMMYTIQFNFHEEEKETLILRNIEDGQTLLEVAMNNSIGLHHRCGGVCSCTTCHVYIEHGIVNIMIMTNREEDYMARVENRRPNSRLACQSLLLKGRGDIHVVIPDQQMNTER